jgi:hypothetical protein
MNYWAVESIDVKGNAIQVFVLLVLWKKHSLVIVEEMKERLVVVMVNKYNWENTLDITAVKINATYCINARNTVVKSLVIHVQPLLSLVHLILPK